MIAWTQLMTRLAARKRRIERQRLQSRPHRVGGVLRPIADAIDEYCAPEGGFGRPQAHVGLLVPVERR